MERKQSDGTSNPSPTKNAQLSEHRSADYYIDETPVWRDGTSIPQNIFTSMQWRIWWLATAGKFFEGMIVFMTGVSHTLIAKEFGLSAFSVGFVTSATLFGILVGAITLGGLSDHYGRRKMFIAEMIMFIFFLVILTFADSFLVIVISLFGLGLALGCDYPTAHMMISESMASRMRGRLVLGAFSFQAVGILVGTGLAFLVLSWYPSLEAWRYMYAAAIVPAILITIGRFYIPESAMWLLAKGRMPEAEKSISQLLKRDPPYPSRFLLKNVATAETNEKKIGELSSIKHLLQDKNSRKAIKLSSIPWFLQDLGTYGVGIFTPVILANVLGYASPHAHSISELIHNKVEAAKGAALIDVMLVVGVILAIIFVDRVGRIRLQVLGFLGCALGLLIAAYGESLNTSQQLPFIFGGLMLFNLMNNMGPNSQTYLIAGEVFPTRYRGAGAGLAASISKFGGVAIAFFFPILLSDIGASMLLSALAVTSLIGAMITWKYRIEMTGKSLDDVG
ncbi:MFS transporter [Microbulbifer sp. JTAC008]|uniref:MFS transporter n=1 Tax=unclassified Microbulbifer TaxID=2619833 RepID=UPI00403A1659